MENEKLFWYAGIIFCFISLFRDDWTFTILGLVFFWLSILANKNDKKE